MAWGRAGLVKECPAGILPVNSVQAELNLEIRLFVGRELINPKILKIIPA